MSAANPVKAWRATINAGQYLSHGQTATFLFDMTQGWEAQIPVGVRYGSNVSVATPIFVLPSNDGGATYDSEPLATFPVAIATAASAKKTATVRLTTGMYAIAVVVSSPSVTVFLHTQEIITAYNIV